MLKHDSSMKNLLIPKGSPLYSFLIALATDLTIGSDDDLNSSRQIMRRARRSSIPYRSASYLTVARSTEKRSEFQLFDIAVDHPGEFATSPGYSETLSNLSMSDMEALFEGIGKAILEHKHQAKVR